MEATTSNPSSTYCTTWRFGIPRAWYWRQSHNENGDSRSIWFLTVRSKKTCAAWNVLGSSSNTENAAAVASTNPPAKAPSRRGRQQSSGYVSHIGATTSVANFVHDESAAKIPRAHADVMSQKPQIRNAAGIESFVFELDTYCVNGSAAHAKGSAAASIGPPNRKPTRPRPTRQRRSTTIDVRCTAGSLSHFPDQPRTQ